MPLMSLVRMHRVFWCRQGTQTGDKFVPPMSLVTQSANASHFLVHLFQDLKRMCVEFLHGLKVLIRDEKNLSFRPHNSRSDAYKNI